MGEGGNKRVSNGLLALSSAAVLAVYSAGYVRTRAAAERFALQTETRRPFIPAPVPAAPPAAASAAPAPVPGVVAVKSADANRASTRRREVLRKKRTPRAVSNTPDATAAPAPAALAVEPAATPVVEPPPSVAAPEPASVPVAPPAAPKYRDGTYYGWGTSRHGDIQAAVVIEEGRISSAIIAQCLTRYSCNVIAALPPQVAQRQSPEVDYVSGATQSTNAFYYAVVDALSKAK